MKKVIAILVYTVGSVSAARSVIAGMVNESLVDWLIGIAYAIGIWWICAGIGIRLGTSPNDFLGAVGSLLGLEPSSRGADEESTTGRDHPSV